LKQRNEILTALPLDVAMLHISVQPAAFLLQVLLACREAMVKLPADPAFSTVTEDADAS